jgi:hypothetical protein
LGLPAPAALAAALSAAYAGVTAVVRDLDDFDLLLPSGCRGWTICDLLLHLSQADPASLIRTQNLVLPVPDFIATLVTEAVIHHLDLIVSLPDAPDPAAEAVAIAMSTVDGLAGGDGLPAHWSEREALLKCSGREELTADDREALGDRAELFPLLS